MGALATHERLKSMDERRSRKYTGAVGRTRLSSYVSGDLRLRCTTRSWADDAAGILKFQRPATMGGVQSLTV